MKTIRHTWIGIVTLYCSTINYSIDIHQALESNLTDDILSGFRKYKQYVHEEGISRLLITRCFQTDTYLGQFALPLKKTKQSLTRWQINIVNQGYKEEDANYLYQTGPSGRYILNSQCIVGSYIFLHGIEPSKNKQEISKLVNIGLEGFWPKYGLTLQGDAVLAPNPFSKAYNNSLYQASIKAGMLKPEVFEIYTGFTCIKSDIPPSEFPYQPTTWQWTIVGGHLKPLFFVKKWRINQRFSFGGSIIYIRDHQYTWSNRRNLKGSIYLQWNLLQKRPQNSFQDYLRLPIDRSFAIPYDLGNNPAQYQHRVDRSNSNSSSPVINLSDLEKTSDFNEEVHHERKDSAASWGWLHVLTPRASRNSLRPKPSLNSMNEEGPSSPD